MNTTGIFNKVINQLSDKTLQSILNFSPSDEEGEKSKKNSTKVKKEFKELFYKCSEEEKAKYIKIFFRTHFFANDKSNFQRLISFFQMNIKKEDFEKLKSIENIYEKVFWLINEREELTERAYKISYKHNIRKFWQKRNDYYQKIEITEEVVNSFGKSLSKLLSEKEIRGGDCISELITYEDKHYIFFTLSDIPQEIPTFENGKINNSYKKPAFAVAIIVDHKNRCVSIASDSGSTKALTHQHFAKELLSKEIELKSKNNTVYNMQKVLEHYISHGKLTPQKEYKLIKNIELKKLKLKLKSYNFTELSVDIGNGKPEDTIFRIVKRFIRDSREQSEQYFNLQDVLATGAEFFVTHIESEGEPTDLEKTFSIDSYGNANLSISAIDDELRLYLSDMEFLKKNEQKHN